MLLAVCVGHRMTTGRHAAELTLGRELISKSKHNLMRWSGSHDRRFGFRLTHGRFRTTGLLGSALRWTMDGALY